jgi:hypothetical protein
MIHVFIVWLKEEEERTERSLDRIRLMGNIKVAKNDPTNLKEE